MFGRVGVVALKRGYSGVCCVWFITVEPLNRGHDCVAIERLSYSKSRSKFEQ